MIIRTAYMVYWQSADSYHSFPTLPKAVFMEEHEAIKFAKEQQGYGYNVDWFVKPVDLYSNHIFQYIPPRSTE